MMKRACKQCGREFELTDSQIDWYKSKNLEVPKRCEECRAANKKQRGTSAGSANAPARKSADARSDDKKPEPAFKSAAGKSPRTIVAALIAVALAAVVGGNAVLGQNSPTSPDSGSSSSNAALVSQSSASATASSTTAKSSASASQTYRFRSSSRLNEHYQKHGAAMGFADASAYEQAANAVIHNPEALHKVEKEDGDDVYYVQATDEIVFVSQDGYIRTYFNPGGIDYFNRQ